MCYEFFESIFVIRSLLSFQLKMAEVPEKKARVNTDLENFDSLFPLLVDVLTKQGLKDGEISSAMAYFKEVRSNTHYSSCFTWDSKNGYRYPYILLVNVH